MHRILKHFSHYIKRSVDMYTKYDILFFRNIRCLFYKIINVLLDIKLFSKVM